MDHERGFDQSEPASTTGDNTAPTPGTGEERGTTRTRECELPGCGVVFPVAGKKKYCTKEHANEAARRRTVLETLAVDLPLEELRTLRDQVLDQVGPDVTRLIGQLGGLLDRFAALETGAVARIADAEQTAADATATAQRAEQSAADADRRATDALNQAERDRAGRIAAVQAQRSAQEQARTADDERVRADSLKDAAVLAAAAADSRAELSAEATLAATERAAQERARADALQAELDRARGEHAAEVQRLGKEARVAAAAAQDRADTILRQLGEQTDARIEGVRAQHVTQVEQIRSTMAAEVSAARAETDRATQRHTDAIREIERERARGQAARDRLVREVRRALGDVLDAPDDGVDSTGELAAARVQRLRVGVSTVLRNLDDLADAGEVASGDDGVGS